MRANAQEITVAIEKDEKSNDAQKLVEAFRRSTIAQQDRQQLLVSDVQVDTCVPAVCTEFVLLSW